MRNSIFRCKWQYFPTWRVGGWEPFKCAVWFREKPLKRKPGVELANIRNTFWRHLRSITEQTMATWLFRYARIVILQGQWKLLYKSRAYILLRWVATMQLLSFRNSMNGVYILRYTWTKSENGLRNLNILRQCENKKYAEHLKFSQIKLYHLLYHIFSTLCTKRWKKK